MEASLRFIVRRPPRTGWILFCLALLAVYMLPSMLMYSPLGLPAGSALLAAPLGLLLGLGGRRYLRPFLLLPALLIPLLLLELVPPWRVIAADARALLPWRAPRPPLRLPAAVYIAAMQTWTTLRAAWTGDTASLNWSISHLAALVGYLAALVLGIGLRRGSRPIAWSLPLLAALAATGITVRSGALHILLGFFAVLLVCLVGGFVSRERAWEREGVGFSDVLRWDVAAFGTAVLVGALLLGLLIPATPRNFVTTWLWSDVRLPAGLARLDKPDVDVGAGLGLGRARIGGSGPGQNLELGRSLERGDRSEVALSVRVQGLAEGSRPYWRGRVFDQYTGRGWTTGPLRAVPVKPLSLGQTPRDMVRQEVTDYRGGRNLRYGVPDIVASEQSATLEETDLGASAGWVGSENRYTVYSQAPAPLDLTGSQAVETQRLLQSYLALPPNMPARVVQLTRQLTANALTQTERAAAIESYLRGLRYSYEVAPLPADGDAVEQFLFTMRQGYCTYYASAMAVMARIAGIPSRVAVGYATGTYDPPNQVYVVRESEAHAWPELYLDGEGWTRWEPTPIRPVPERAISRPAPRVDTTAPAPTAVRSNVPWWPVFAVVGLFVALLLIGRLRRLAQPLSAAGVHRDLYRCGRRLGILPRRGDSVEEYAGRFTRAVPAARPHLDRVGRLLTARLYRETPLTPTEERTLVSAWYTARGMLQRRRTE